MTHNTIRRNKHYNRNDKLTIQHVVLHGIQLAAGHPGAMQVSLGDQVWGDLGGGGGICLTWRGFRRFVTADEEQR